jgi:hypothetical protein
MFTKRRKTGKSERGFVPGSAVEPRLEQMRSDIWHWRFVIGHLKHRFAMERIDRAHKMAK